MTARDTGGERVSRIADVLLRYIESNPHASDTLDGIGRWWLANESISREDLSRALAKLVADGRLDTFASPDGRCHWRKRQAG
jgi:hypothetical protein